MEPEAPQPAPARRFGWRAKLVLLASTMALLLLLDFAAAHAYRLVTGHPWPAGNPARVYRIPADPYHHGLRPNFSTDGAEWGGNYPFRTNSLGMKDAAVRDVPLVPSGRRIVVIGDSFTEGVGVPFEESFAGRLASALAPGTDVLNAGVQSYTPIIYYAKIRHLAETVGLRFHEVIVAVDPSDVRNELEYHLDGDEVRPVRFRDRLAEALRTNSIVLWTIAQSIKGEQTFVELRREGVSTGRTAAEAARLPTDAEIEAALRELRVAGQMPWPNRALESQAEAGIRSMVENMDRLLALLKSKGIPLTVVVYPWPDQVIEGDPDCHHVRIWREWCGKNGVRFVDAFPKFEVGAPWKRRAEILEECYIPGDSHFNAEGHRRVAEAILDAMK